MGVLCNSLAYCELYLTIFSMFKPDSGIAFELFETGIEDVEIKHDFFNACQGIESRGIRVVVK